MSNAVTSDRVPFATTPNALLNDGAVSLSAKGMYAFMEGKPAGWNFTIRSMAKQLKEGETAISNALRELRESGWVSYTKHSDGKGSYHLRFDLAEGAYSGNPNQGYQDKADPKPENPNQGYPMQGKPQRISKKDSVVRNIDSKNGSTNVDPEHNSNSANKFNDEDFEKFWKFCRDHWFGNPGHKAEARAEFAKLSPKSDDLHEVLKLTRNECDYRRRVQAAEGFCESMKHICRWLKVRGWEDTKDRIENGPGLSLVAGVPKPSSGARKPFPGINHAALPTGTGGDL